MKRKSDKELYTPKVRLILFFTEKLSFNKAEKLFGIPDKDLQSVRRYVCEKDRVLHLVSAYLKNKYVGEWTVNEYGKPVSDVISFNVSHCNGAVALVLSDKDVGVDVENVRKTERSVAEYVSGDKELYHVNDDKDFFKLWTAKESLVKCQGKGLIKDLKSIPAFPFNGEKEYSGEKYYSEQVEKGEFIITVVRKGKEPFTMEIEKVNNLGEKI